MAAAGFLSRYLNGPLSYVRRHKTVNLKIAQWVHPHEGSIRRPIAPCLEIFFKSVINNRLLKWSYENSIVTGAQFGFKPGYGTHDAIFSLHTVISKVLSSKKKLYCCFVDYRKAFDSVNRYKPLFKLARSGIIGKLYGIIKSMYESLKSSVKFQSPCFHNSSIVMLV